MATTPPSGRSKEKLYYDGRRKRSDQPWPSPLALNMIRLWGGREEEEQWLASPFKLLFCPLFLLFLTPIPSANRRPAGGKGSNQSCLSSRPFSFCPLSRAFLLRSLSVLWLAAPPLPPLPLHLCPNTRQMSRTGGGVLMVVEWMWFIKTWLTVLYFLFPLELKELFTTLHTYLTTK